MADQTAYLIARKPPPPPLPPRASSNQVPRASTIPSDAPPPYESVAGHSAEDSPSWSAHDPRSSSTQSLIPSESNEQRDRRKLLLIYVHGFMGDETSFQSFPAHVHNLVTALVAETHVVHTKVYPRYRSKRNITFARDDFSRWFVLLAPHEDETTDTILLGHSMGGLLSAEVVLLSSTNPGGALQHRILGSINFDVPFLGMHPGVIKSGLASIFHPAADSPKPTNENRNPMSPIASPMEGVASPNASTSSIMSPMSPGSDVDSFFAPPPSDPNFNPAFRNDVVLPVRKGWKNAWHFVNKHSDNLAAATKQLVKSHLEFGGAMADFSGLKQRYVRIRALEESDVAVRQSVMGGQIAPERVRFVNYYTASTGRPKKPKTPSPMMSPAPSTQDLGSTLSVSDALPQAERTRTHGSSPAASVRSRSKSPRLSLEEHSDEGIIQKELEDPHEGVDIVHEDDYDDDNMSQPSMDHLEPRPLSSLGSVSDTAESWADAMEDMKLEPETEPTMDLTATAPSSQPEPLQAPDPDIQSLSTMETQSIAPPESLISPTDSTPASTLQSHSTLSLTPSTSLPPIPPLPSKPTQPDFSIFPDKDTRKVAEKEFSRASKAYEKAVKDRQKALRDRTKLEEKLARKAEKEREKAAKLELKEKERMKVQRGREYEERLRIERRETEREWEEVKQEEEEEEEGNEGKEEGGSEEMKRGRAELWKWNATDSPLDGGPAPGLDRTATAASTAAPTSSSAINIKQKQTQEKPKPAREGKFCMLPPKDSAGNRDPCWIRVFMRDVDEVGAHCGLFFLSEHYERLVGDVAGRVEEWVMEAEGERVARGFDLD